MGNKTCGACKHLCNHQIIGTCQCIGICTGSIPACSKFEPKVITHGDRIRQMSNDELAKEFLKDGCLHCAFFDRQERHCNLPKDKDCPDGIEAWLNAPAESGVSND